MDLIVISNPLAVHNEADIINALFNKGLKLFHLRKPGFSDEETLELLNKIDPKYYSRIALHQNFGLTDKFPIKRLHFPEPLRLQTSEKDLFLWNEKGFTLSTSIHSIKTIASLSQAFSYAFMGPVFESITKEGYKPQGAEMINLKSNTHRNIKIYAIGGVTPDKFEKLKGANFDGAALLGYIWTDPEKSICNFEECFAKNNFYV